MTWTLLLATVTCSFLPGSAEEEQRRIKLIDRLRPSVVAVFGQEANNGGSGVLISSDGYAITNYHVISGAGPALRCGLVNGELYDAVLVGIDPVGDVALIQLLGRDDFKAATLGNSDELVLGQEVLAMGNPFLLATDFQPSVSLGIVSGLHRYQYPAQSTDSSLLEYTDCIQTDASINPGNSGGPLFDLQGTVVGINGRISLDKRGRVNVGVGYAISINQIKNFLTSLKGGLIVDHARSGVTVTTAADGRVIVNDVVIDSDAYRQGLRRGDEVLSFGERTISSPNEFLNVEGLHPQGWRVEMTLRRETNRFQVFPLMLGKNRRTELTKLMPAPKKKIRIPEEVAPLFKYKQGFANDHFNRLQTERLLQTIDKPKGSSESSSWKSKFQTAGSTNAAIEISPRFARWTVDDLTLNYPITEKSEGGSVEQDFTLLLAFLSQWRSFILGVTDSFATTYYNGTYKDASGSIFEVITTEHAGTQANWLFKANSLSGGLFRLDATQRWLEVRFAGSTPQGLPKSFEVTWPGQPSVILKTDSWEITQ